MMYDEDALGRTSMGLFHVPHRPMALHRPLTLILPSLSASRNLGDAPTHDAGHHRGDGEENETVMEGERYDANQFSTIASYKDFSILGGTKRKKILSSAFNHVA